MGIEIERKFLVAGSSWRSTAQPERCLQGYVLLGKGNTVRVRVRGDRGYLTIKGAGKGLARREFEYEIPVADAREMLANLCAQPLIEKDRYVIEHHGTTWEIDEFMGENKGLVVAEVELASEGQSIVLPDWVGQEVTGDPRYFNVALVAHPYSNWKNKS